VTKQQRWAGTRRQIMAMELERVRRPVAVTETEAAESGFEPEIPPEWTPEGLRPSVGAPDADYASTVAAQA
jgi:hypothetical protein